MTAGYGTFLRITDRAQWDAEVAAERGRSAPPHGVLEGVVCTAGGLALLEILSGLPLRAVAV